MFTAQGNSANQIFDSKFDQRLGVVCYFQVVDGSGFSYFIAIFRTLCDNGRAVGCTKFLMSGVPEHLHEVANLLYSKNFTPRHVSVVAEKLLFQEDHVQSEGRVAHALADRAARIGCVQNRRLFAVRLCREF